MQLKISTVYPNHHSQSIWQTIASSIVSWLNWFQQFYRRVSDDQRLGSSNLNETASVCLQLILKTKKIKNCSSLVSSAS